MVHFFPGEKGTIACGNPQMVASGASGWVKCAVLGLVALRSILINSYFALSHRGLTLQAALEAAWLKALGWMWPGAGLAVANGRCWVGCGQQEAAVVGLEGGRKRRVVILHMSLVASPAWGICLSGHRLSPHWPATAPASARWLQPWT